MCNAVNLFVHSLVCSLLLPSFYRSRKEASEHRMLLFLFYRGFDLLIKALLYSRSKNISPPIRPELSSIASAVILLAL